MFLFMLHFPLLGSNKNLFLQWPIRISSCRVSNGRLPGFCALLFLQRPNRSFVFCVLTLDRLSSVWQEQSPSNATSLAMMQEPQEVVEETVTIEEDPGTPTSHVSVVTSDDGTTRRTETKVRGCVRGRGADRVRMKPGRPAA